MGWFRERRRLKLFTRAWQQTSKDRFSEGAIDVTTYAKCVTAGDRPKVMRQLMKQTETEPGLYGGIKDWDWDAILTWIQEYFIPLMKALLPLLLVLDLKTGERK